MLEKQAKKRRRKEAATAVAPQAEKPQGNRLLELPESIGRKLPPPEVRVDLLWAAGVIACTGIVFLLLRLVPGAVLPMLLALGLAWALDPLVDRYEARGFSRTLSILVLAAMLAVAGLAVLAFLVPALVDQAARLPDYLQALAGRILPLAERLLERQLPATWHELFASFSGRAAALAQQILPGAGELLLRAAGGTASAFSQLMGLALVPLLLFYFLRDFDRMKARAATIIPPRHRVQIVARFRAIDEVLAAFVRGQLTVAAILGGIYAVGLTLSGVKLGLVIGLVAGVAAMVPFAGMAIGVLLAFVSVLVDWHDGSLWVAAGAAATFAVGQALEGSVITPRIVGEKVGLPPVVVLLAVLGFGELLGFAGLILAVPLAALLQVVFKVLGARYRASAWFSAGEEAAGEEKAAPGDYSA